MSYTLSDITWFGNADTLVGKTPTGVKYAIEKIGSDIQMDIDEEPVAENFETMEDAKEYAERQASELMRHMSCVDILASQLESAQIGL
jgi:hypothetical protein